MALEHQISFFWFQPPVSKQPVVVTKTRLFKYIENFTTKIWKFLDKNSDIFF